ncbi:outer membrane beta-barrel protein [Hymenobacter siberiensis]|uniref:outer membrane beta-barrel protein n=1 Tax=Hymenobacter siberiensis TaxID=2848396 RepID=UPI001C1E5183|nr:outer membrane beta-barrel protein [Hymenobacter siberiensis]
MGQLTIPVAPKMASTSLAQLAESRLRQRTAQAQLPARAVTVPQAAWPEPVTPQPVAVVPGPLPRPFASRWAVQVVAGPALTYRSLTTATSAATQQSTSPPFVYISANSTATPIATLERAALGSAAQVTVRRTLGEHWSLSAGLGYAEYASGLALQQVHYTVSNHMGPTPDSATTSIHRRDTYRFVTVPVRVGYGWTLSGRWRVGLLAGAEAAVYVGGSNTEGSTYHRVSLGASLGAEARYRLGRGRWELLAQPTATYLLSPLTNYTPYYQRHLFGGAALLGVAFNLP